MDETKTFTHCSHSHSYRIHLNSAKQHKQISVMKSLASLYLVEEHSSGANLSGDKEGAHESIGMAQCLCPLLTVIWQPVNGTNLDPILSCGLRYYVTVRVTATRR